MNSHSGYWHVLAVALCAACIASGCGRVVRVDTIASAVCDSLDIVFESGQVALQQERWNSFVSGDLKSLNEARSRWSAYLESSGKLDTLRMYERLAADTLLQRRLTLARWRILAELSTNDPAVFPIVDSLFAQRLTIRSVLPALPDSLAPDSLPQAFQRRSMYRRSLAGGEGLKDWPARLTRLRNQRSRSYGYNSTVDMNLEMAGISKDELVSVLRRVDSATLPTYQNILETIKSQIGVTRPGVEDLFFYRQYMAPGTDNRGIQITRRRALRACKAALKDLRLSIDNRPLFIDTQSVRWRIFEPALVAVHPPGDVRLLMGGMGGITTFDYLSNLSRTLGQAVYLTEVIERPFTQRQSPSPLWERAMGQLISDIVFTKDYVMTAAWLDQYQWKKIRPWLRNRRIIELRERLALIQFELEMYENPNRDLKELFWDVYERFLLVTPERELYPWAKYFELISVPAAQFCWLYSSLISAQTFSHAVREFDSVEGNPEFGIFLSAAFYGPGATRGWSDKLLDGLGERLNADYFLNQFTSGPLPMGK